MDQKPDSTRRQKARDKQDARNRARKQPRKLSTRYLENAALYYLQRYATSAGNFRKVMTRKIDRSCAFHQTAPEEFYAFVEELVKRYISVGLLDDKGFAAAKVSSLRRQGRSKRDIQAKLQAKGLAAEDIETALAARDAETAADDDSGESAELIAARRLAKKKKLGPYNPRPSKDPAEAPKERQKELAALARAGFSYDVAQKALQPPEDDGDGAEETD